MRITPSFPRMLIPTSVQKICLLFLCASLLAVSKAYAHGLVFADDNLQVYQDFVDLVIPEEQRKELRAFLDTGDPAHNSVPESELTAIRATTIQSLEGKVSIVPQKQDANLLITVLAYKWNNYAIRNSKHEPAHGLILVSFCRLPITRTENDCENLNYYYFADVEPIDVLPKVLALSIDAVFKEPAKP